jgi:hypothetical protein
MSSESRLDRFERKKKLTNNGETLKNVKKRLMCNTNDRVAWKKEIIQKS